MIKDDDACINGNTKDAKNIIQRAKPCRLKMEMKVLFDQSVLQNQRYYRTNIRRKPQMRHSRQSTTQGSAYPS